MRFAEYSWFLIVLLLVVLWQACKKVDEIGPAVNISQPSEGTLYSIYDTIRVQFTAYDETKLNSIDLKLVNSDFVPVSSTVNENPESASSNYTSEVVIGDKLLETADYYVLVSASDGRNETREFRKVRISALPKKRRAVYFSDSNIPAIIWKLDSSFQNLVSWSQPAQDILKLCINSLSDRLTVVGSYSTVIRTYNIDNSAAVWSDEVFPVSQTERYLDLLCHKNEVYVSIYDREIRSYNANGALTMNQFTGNHRPETIFANDDFLLVEQNLVGDDKHFVFVYHAATRALLRQIELPMDVVSVCPLEQNRVLIFGNEQGQARVFDYDIATNGYWEPRQLPTGNIIDVVKMDGMTYGIAHEDGLYSYTYSPNYLNLIRPGVVYNDLCFDLDKGTIIGASLNLLEELAPNGQVVNSVVHSENISSVDIHYTR